MTRKSELLLSRVLTIISICLICAAAALLARVFFTEPEPTPIAPVVLSTAPAALQELQANPKLSRLTELRMTRTVVPRIEVAPKPPAPNLASLLRVKGIMDFGKSQSNEAIIEILRVNQTRSFKVGETVPDAGATITKIDSAVTFAYDGKSVRLEVNATESAELPTAGIGGETLSDGSARSKP